MGLHYHLTTWAAFTEVGVAGAYDAAASLAEALSALELVALANQRFRDRTDLVALAIDVHDREPGDDGARSRVAAATALDARAPLPAATFVAAFPMRRSADGSFALPEGASMLQAPLLHFDPSPMALIEPTAVLEPIDIAPRCVLCFFNNDVISDLNNSGRLREVHTLGTETGPNPVYEVELNGQRLAVCHPGVGAPLAAGFMEELIALGCRTFIACGGAGVLLKELVLGHVVVPTEALRDEGTSYHYLPAGREVRPDADAVGAILETLERAEIPYRTGPTWTTDGIYRETQAKVERRRSSGCLTVEMEAAAMFAVARFRGVRCAQLLYGGDDLSGAIWDARAWQSRTSIRERLFWLAAEACLACPVD